LIEGNLLKLSCYYLYMGTYQDYAKLVKWDSNMDIDERFECIICARTGSPRSATGVIKKKQIQKGLQLSSSSVALSKKRAFSPLVRLRKLESFLSQVPTKVSEPALSVPVNSPITFRPRARSVSLPIKDLLSPRVYNPDVGKFTLVKEDEDFEVIDVYHCCPECASKIKGYHIEF